MGTHHEEGLKFSMGCTAKVYVNLKHAWSKEF